MTSILMEAIEKPELLSKRQEENLMKALLLFGKEDYSVIEMVYWALEGGMDENGLVSACRSAIEDVYCTKSGEVF